MLAPSRLSLLTALSLVLLYVIVFLLFDQLLFPPIRDEPDFWRASLNFSDRLIPQLADLKNYKELNTPLPFVVFGILEHVWQGGIFAGRLLNLALSLGIAAIVAFPTGRASKQSILAVCGLLSFPYYLLLSTHLFTDIFATFFVLIGIWFYTRDRHLISGFAFILAIASRQLMLAFPVAIAIYELLKGSQIRFRPRMSWLAPLAAASTIFGWIWFFNGLAPAAAIEQAKTPEVQKTLWMFSLSPSLYFLSTIGLYFVLPEWLLFSRKIVKPYWTKQRSALAGALMLLFVLFPVREAHGLLMKGAEVLPSLQLENLLLYGLALLTCVRFLRYNLAFWLLLANCGLMLKAYPWDKYALALLAVFWFYKAIGQLDSSGNTQTVSQST